MLKIRFRKQFRKDYKRVLKQPGHTPELCRKCLTISSKSNHSQRSIVTMPYPATMPTSVSATFCLIGC